MKRILGYVLILFGLYAFLFLNIIMGAVFIAFGVNFISTTGSQINLTNKTYRKITSLFGIHFGTWKPCPEFEYVSIFKTNESQTVNFITATATSSERLFFLTCSIILTGILLFTKLPIRQMPLKSQSISKWYFTSTYWMPPKRKRSGWINQYPSFFFPA